MSGTGISIRQLRYFVTVAKARSFSAAARALNVSQPALGLQVKDLEERVGAALLERHARGVSLTTAGETFHPHALDVLAALERAERCAAALAEGAQEQIVLGVTPTIGRVLVEDLMDEAEHAGPRLNLREALTSELIRWLREGEIDAAFCYDPPADAVYEAAPLFEEDLVLVGRPGQPHFERPVSLEELADVPMALGARNDASREVIERAAAAAGVRLDIRAEIAPTSLKREMLIRRGLCSIVPYGLFLPDIRAGLLHSVAITPPIRRTMTLAMRRELAPASRARLIAVASEAVRSRAQQGQLGWRPVAAES